MDPISMIDIDSSQEEKILDLSNKIEELDDVQNVYMNVNLN
jgi:transcriptional/translational regulatory protein YebC/TACO1